MPENNISSQYDVVIIGSGAGGMLAAIRAHDLGMSSIIVEKAHQYGGTSAISGSGVWIPMNESIAHEDTQELALDYLSAASGISSNDPRLRTYVETAPIMIKYLRKIGVKMKPFANYPDYYTDLPGAFPGRTMIAEDMDGALLGDEFEFMRQHHPWCLAFNRYAVGFDTGPKILERLPGWRQTALRLILDYWLDIPWRLQTQRDRRLVMGRALIGGLRKAMLDRQIPLVLNTRMIGLIRNEGRITGATLERHKQQFGITANKAVILATGGFEHNQEMRDQFHPVPTNVASTVTPVDQNTGDSIKIGLKNGAAIENMENAWWTPTIRIPSVETPNVVVTYPSFMDRAKPGAIVINHLGKRFGNESASYEPFVQDMIDDQRQNSAGSYWMLFDARFRSKYPAGGILPSWILPDKKVPREWWDFVIYSAPTLKDLATKICVNSNTLTETVKTFNRFAEAGVDGEFQRGQTYHDRFFGEVDLKDNTSLAPIDTAPYYAVELHIGDIGTKGGLKIDDHARVLDNEERPILGLYAIGNTTGSIFGNSYPGAGATLGPAMVFSCIAVDTIIS